MATIIDSLKCISSYPIPQRTIVDALVGRGLAPDAEVDETVLNSKAYKSAVADLYCWLAVAPNISQGGQSYSFTNDERAEFRNRARGISGKSVRHGYKGDKL